MRAGVVATGIPTWTTRPVKARDVIPSDYFDGRRRFLAAAQLLQAWMQAYPISAPGPRGEPLTIDTAYLGSGTPRRLLIVSSGTHGVEGPAGTALQLAYLKQLGARVRRMKGAGVLLVHALNPYGYACGRRTNEHNIDLNRNALENFPGPPNRAYARLNAWLNPPSPPHGTDFFLVRGAWHLITKGPAAIKQAIAGGQYEFPKGIFYGGTGMAESTRRFIQILGDATFRSVERVVHIDVHTGLGRHGEYKLLVDFEEKSEEFGRMREWFGAQSVQGNRPNRSIAYRVSGGLTALVARTFPNAEVYPAVLEFGTHPITRVISALRAENRAHFFGQRETPAGQRAKAALLATFFPRQTSWRTTLIKRGLRVLRQAQVVIGGESGIPHTR